MAVHDVAVGALQAELPQNADADVRVVVVGVIGVFALHPRRLVGDERPLKGGDVVPPEEGGVAPAPEEPQKVLA